MTKTTRAPDPSLETIITKRGEFWVRTETRICDKPSPLLSVLLNSIHDWRARMCYWPFLGEHEVAERDARRALDLGPTEAAALAG